MIGKRTYRLSSIIFALIAAVFITQSFVVPIMESKTDSDDTIEWSDLMEEENEAEEKDLEKEIDLFTEQVKLSIFELIHGNRILDQLEKSTLLQNLQNPTPPPELRLRLS